ncbi:MAG: ClpXP protease specificity-enhancing factor [Gammaproteobacteria bacterium]|nr:ClpXP protease specificity-enhancing factor [Gammaproteobacteria bacterium]
MIRAFHEWAVDNELTPHLLVDTSKEGVNVPRESVRNARVVLNISPGAVRDLELANEFVRFSARFSGVARQVLVPVDAVLAIYTRENGQGLNFMALQDPDRPSPEDGPTARGKGQPSLRLVKS